MPTKQQASSHSGAPRLAAVDPFAAMSARRWLILGGMTLILAGMVFGDVFAVFVLHQNAGDRNEQMLAATQAVAARDAGAVITHFATLGALQENRGTKVDTHVHIIAFGYLALLLALLQPYVALSGQGKKQMALLFLTGAVLLPVSVFLIPYVGLAYSPLPTIGWASIFADFGGLLVIVACAGEGVGLWRYLRGAHATTADGEGFTERSWATRTLLAGGTLLVLAGFLHGAYYAGVNLYAHEEKEVTLLRAMVDNAASNDLMAARQAVNAYGTLQGERAVQIAAHAHIIEFGFLALLLAFIQGYVFLSERWKRRWVMIFLLGSVLLPVFVLLEVSWGGLAGGIADGGGLLVILSLLGMLVGVLRYTGKLDAQKG
ncbi:MAG: hypothetical protein ACE5HL_00795 [Terriglobia bacterium]